MIGCSVFELGKELSDVVSQNLEGNLLKLVVIRNANNKKMAKIQIFLVIRLNF